MHRAIYYSTCLLICTIILACSHDNNHTTEAASYRQIQTDYAIQYTIRHGKDSFFILTGEQKNNVSSAIFSFPGDQQPEKIICLSTTHLPFLKALDKQECIVGISSPGQVYSDIIKKNNPVDVGYEPNLDFEAIIALQPDLVLAYSIQGESASHIRKLQQLEIPVLLINEYLEPHPLGRAEWIKVFGVLFHEEQKADSIFLAIENKYLHIKENSRKKETRPGILIGLPFKGTWHMPGGDSYFSTLIEDAGGNYLFKHLSSKNESVIVSFEEVLKKKDNADIWINTGTAKNLNDIIQFDPRLSHLKPIKTGDVFNNNARLSDQGGNDFWESGILQPHIILKDLYHIFHQGDSSMIEDSLYYYKAVTF